jgi:hypothetical protein
MLSDPFRASISPVKMHNLENRGGLVHQTEKERLHDFRGTTSVVHCFTCGIPYQLPDNNYGILVAIEE